MDRLVECGTCTACCRAGLGVRLVQADDLAAFPVRAPVMDKSDPTIQVGWALPQRADGACHYLGDAGCTVYEKRPHMCRGFDCRDLLRDPVAETKPYLAPILSAARARS